MAKSNQFIKQYFGNKKEIGAIAPSSKFLRNRMMAPISFHSADVIIELGAGNGVFTKEIIKKKATRVRVVLSKRFSKYWGMVVNPIFKYLGTKYTAATMSASAEVTSQAIMINPFL